MMANSDARRASVLLAAPGLVSAGVLVAMLSLAVAARYTLHNADQGDSPFVPMMIWRLIAGQIPCQDFVCVRPLADEVLLARLLSWLPDALWLPLLMSGAIVAQAITALLSIFIWRQLAPGHAKITAWLALAGFILALAGFPLTTWHTTNALCFMTMAVALSLSQRQAAAFLAGAFAALATLTKQPFALPALGLLLVLMQASSRRALAHAAGFVTFLVSITVLAGVDRAHVRSFLTGAPSSLSLGALGEVARLAFDRCLPALALVAAWLLPHRIARLSLLAGRLDRLITRPGLLCGLLCGGIIAVQLPGLWEALQRQTNGSLQTQTLSWTLLFLAGALLLRAAWPKLLRIELVLVLIAAASAVSWGAPDPGRAMALILPSFALLLSAPAQRPVPWSLGLFVAIQALFMFVIFERCPYSHEEPSPRAATTFNLGDVAPKLTGLHVTQREHAAYRQLFAFHEQVGQVAVVPEVGWYDFAVRQRPLLPIDWELDAERGGQNDAIAAALERTRYVAFRRHRNQVFYQRGQRFSYSWLVDALGAWRVRATESEWWLLENPRFLDRSGAGAAFGDAFARDDLAAPK